MSLSAASKIKNKYHAEKSIALYILFSVLLMLCISQKSYYYIDEYASYALSNISNNSFVYCSNTVPESANFKDGVRYEPASKAFAAITGVDDSRRFNYVNVWKNQINDTHPPFYYMLLHTSCSFFPGIFSKWFAGFINVISALWLFWIARQLICQFTNDRFILLLISLAMLLSPALLNAAAFFRQYLLAAAFVMSATVLCIKQTGNNAQWNRKFYVCVFVTTLLSALTHYFCILYIVLLSGVFVIWLLRNREFEHAAKFIFAQFCAGVTSIAIFPAMLEHIFNGQHGILYGNAVNTLGVGYFDILLRYINMINCQLFGDSLIVLIPVILFLVLKGGKRNFEQNSFTGTNVKYALIFIPALCYFLFIPLKVFCLSDATINLDFRYTQLVWMPLFTGIFVFLFTRLKYILKSNNVIYMLIVSCVILGSWYCTDWNGRWLYRAYNDYEYLKEPYYTSDCVCLTDKTISAYTVFELEPYKSLTWYKLEKFNPAEFRKTIFGDKLTICIEMPDIQADSIINALITYMPEYKITIKFPLFANLPDFERSGTIYYLDKYRERGAL